MVSEVVATVSEVVATFLRGSEKTVNLVRRGI